MTETDNYYRRRIQEELAAAERAADASVSQIHREMARRYRDMLTIGAEMANGDSVMAGTKGGAIVEQGAAAG